MNLLPGKKQLCREVFGFYESLFVDGTTSTKIATLSDLTFSVCGLFPPVYLEHGALCNNRANKINMTASFF